MAQHFQLDIGLNYKIAKVKWTLGRARPFSWKRFDHSYKRYLGMEIISPNELTGVKCWIDEGFPNPLRKELFTGAERLSSTSRKKEFEVMIASTHAGEKGKCMKVNPRQLCEDFVQLKKSPKALVEFLNKCGDWSESRGFWGRAEYRETARVEIFDPHAFWADQAKIIDARKQGVSAWEDSPYTSHFDFQRSQEFPHLVHTDVYCFDAMMRSVTLDLLKGIRYRLCARPDCGLPFSIDSLHKREYCRQYCGHLVSVRKTRQLEANKQKVKKSGK